MCILYRVVTLFQISSVVGSDDVRDWQTAGALRRPPASQVADRRTPSRVDKRVAPDREGAADKQCLREGKYVITNREEGKGKPPRLFPKTGYSLGYPEPALRQKTEERERRVTLPPVGERNLVMSVCVCLSICLSACISQKPSVQTSPNFPRTLPMTVARLLWWRCDILCTSGFVIT